MFFSNIAFWISYSQSDDFSRSNRVLRSGKVCVMFKLWVLKSQVPPRYPQTSFVVKWQWKSMRSVADDVMLIRNGCTRPTLANGTASTCMLISWRIIRLHIAPCCIRFFFGGTGSSTGFVITSFSSSKNNEIKTVNGDHSVGIYSGKFHLRSENLVRLFAVGTFYDTWLYRCQAFSLCISRTPIHSLISFQD